MCIYLLLNNSMCMTQHLLHGELLPVPDFLKQWITLITDNTGYRLTQCVTWNRTDMGTITTQLFTHFNDCNTLTRFGKFHCRAFPRKARDSNYRVIFNDSPTTDIFFTWHSPLLK